MRWMAMMVIGLALAAVSFADTNVSSAQAAKTVEQYFNSLGTYQANFMQRTQGESFTQEGVFYLNRPKGQFLWNYQSPDKQRLIATGTKLYFVDDEQGGAVTELPVKSGLSRLFTGRALSLTREGLKVTQAEATDTTLTVNMEVAGDLAGGDSGGVEKVQLVFNRAPMALVQANVVDNMGVLTSMAFTDVRQGMPLDSKMFRFTPRLKQVN